MTVADGVRLPVSRHFHYSTFGVRDRHDNIARTGNYICTGYPGTGFFAHSSESHSYHRYINECRKKNNQNMLTLLLGREPNFDKEIKRVAAAFSKRSDEEYVRVLSKYQNMLSLAKEEELLQRVVRAIKDKMGNRPNKMMVSILSHYKSSIATLEHDARSTHLDTLAPLNDEQRAAWEKVIDAFHLLINSRRLWSVYLEDNSQAYEQVFFDMGVFNYIWSDFDTPMMRDHRGLQYFIYPKGIISAKSSTDFEIHQWKDLEIRFNVVDINTLAVRPKFNSHSSHKKKHRHNDALSNLYGATHAQVVGEISIPKLDLRFFVNHTGPADDFVKAIHEFLKLKNH